jgi:ADP-ribosylglycohydrolase
MDFEEKLTGSLFGVAIGDGMGAPVEGWESARIFEQFGKWDLTAFLPSSRGLPTGKGEGRITDDTLMTEALIRAYEKKREHLDAFDYRDYLLAEMTRTAVWLPERQKEMPIIERLNKLEKYTWFRLASFGADPRNAGLGNGINCAIAMFIMPIGAVNAGDPRGAYQEAAALAGAASHSYAVEGAAALTAGYAAALAFDATPAQVTDAAFKLSRDGTKEAIGAVLAATDPADDMPTWIAKARAAFIPYAASLGTCVLEEEPSMRIASTHDPRLAFEEVPVALGALKYGQGDFLRTLRAAVFYGRDCDSIAGMACGLCGALCGAAGIPASLRKSSCLANRRDWPEVARQFAAVAREIGIKDSQRHDRRTRSFN